MSSSRHSLRGSDGRFVSLQSTTTSYSEYYSATDTESSVVEVSSNSEHSCDARVDAPTFMRCEYCGNGAVEFLNGGITYVYPACRILTMQNAIEELEARVHRLEKKI
jgi:hypothetical protein